MSFGFDTRNDIINDSSLRFEAYLFREELRNELINDEYYPEELGSWEYEGKWYHSKFKLYIMILVHQLCDEFGISDIIGLASILMGAPIIPTRAKFKGARPGTSIASKYLSKIPGKFPVNLPTIIDYPKFIGGKGMRISLTKVVGRFIGRAVPILGFGIMAYELSTVLYNTYLIYIAIVSDE